jgi:hypothetical protein
MQASKTGSRTRQKDKQDWQTNRTRRQTDKRDKQDMQTEYTCRQTDKQDNRQVAQLGKTASPLKKTDQKSNPTWPTAATLRYTAALGIFLQARASEFEGRLKTLHKRPN